MPDDDRDSLTGVWHGQYSYPAPQVPPVPFVATLIQFGSLVSGTAHESAQTETGDVAALFSTLEGMREGDAVRFVKTYDPAIEDWQDVIYEGRLNGAGDEIEGNWTIPGVWAGKFLMIRQRGTAKAKAKRKRAEV